MSDWVAERSAHMNDPGFGLGLEGTFKWMLIVAMTAVTFAGSYFFGYLIGSGTEPESLEGPSGAAATAQPGEERVLLTVQISGAGIGRVRIEPRGVSCVDTCEREFDAGTRVTLIADPVRGSRFEGWDDTCSGDERCTFVLDREREVSATFEGTPSPSQCEDGRDNDGDRLLDRADPGCRANSSEAPDNTPKPGTDCQDRIDNDSDGLVDSAQDPGCERDDTEIDGSSAPVAPPPVAPPPMPQCSDGRDNDGDGLVDRAQDPNCATGSSEGAPTTPTLSECRDGRDNDGDRKVDRPADPGCDSDATEAGP